MRTLSIGMMKKNTQCQQQPKAGTKLRDLYDRLRTGERLKLTSADSRMINQLRLFYGVETKGQRGQNGYTQMTGEWYGMELVPIEKIVQENYFCGAENFDKPSSDIETFKIIEEF